MTRGNVPKEKKEVDAMDDAYVVRESITARDIPAVKRLVQEAGNFTDAEIEVALEVAEDGIARGEKSGYHFLWYSIHGTDAGFCCYGPIPCTVQRFEIYWIAVDRNQQHKGIGSLLLSETEKRIRTMDGCMVLLDTSMKNSYLPTRAFYEKNGYLPVARLDNFYAAGDDKAIYRKIL